MDIKKRFKIGDRVTVSSRGGWRNNFTAVVTDGPDPVSTRQGDDYFYYVKFDEPQNDLSDDGPYVCAQILSRYLIGTHINSAEQVRSADCACDASHAVLEQRWPLDSRDADQ